LRSGLRKLKARRLGSTRISALCNIRKFWRENEPHLASPADRKLAHASAHPWLCPAGPRHFAAGLIGLLATSQHLIDRNGKPIGTDFSNVYAAGVLTLSGKAPDAYDPSPARRRNRRVRRPRCALLRLALSAVLPDDRRLLALMPYALALLCWLAVSLPAFMAAVHAIVPRRETWLATAAFPAVRRQSATARTHSSPRRCSADFSPAEPSPVLAGVLLGLLSYKPQFGVLIPLVLLVTGRWTTILSATATVAVLIGASTLLFGMSVWHAFAESATFTRTIVLEAGGTGWEKIQSLFSAVRMWGGSIDAAYAAQGALALSSPPASSGCGARRPHSNSRPRRWPSRACSRRRMCWTTTWWCSASPLPSRPSRTGARLSTLRDFTAGAGLGHPFLTRSIAGLSGIPLGFIVMLALYAMTLRRAASDLGIHAIGSHRLVKA
jgi:hypothetical protein